MTPLLRLVAVCFLLLSFVSNSLSVGADGLYKAGTTKIVNKFNGSGHSDPCTPCEGSESEFEGRAEENAEGSLALLFALCESSLLSLTSIAEAYCFAGSDNYQGLSSLPLYISNRSLLI